MQRLKSFIGFIHGTRWNNSTKRGRAVVVTSRRLKIQWRARMLKFLGGTVGIIFIIGLIVVIALFKLVF
ncbi:small membrane protein YohP [Pseudomonas huanghezhanensis]|uniref:hypothetical protein n=1 Tax=Pseudomonas huanghezhanensis TaxID=3002903 RepID=UPI002285DDF6|nr:hypothetical protein [Pseudomonas sp. BSw22131]